jgi:hypothetical protein
VNRTDGAREPMDWPSFPTCTLIRKAAAMCELLAKCATLIALIHVHRLIGRRAGPRASGLILGLPSSTAVLLVLCGREKGTIPAMEMADASLLGLIAAVALPLAYAKAVRRGWGLAAALAAAVAAYVVIASSLGLVRPGASVLRLLVSFGSILAASFLVSRIGIPTEVSPRPSPSGRWIAVVRTIIPVSYIIIVGLVTGVASPRWAGLVGTFPSMSTVVLAVTHLEEGAASSGRIARALPPANLSTAAFLAAFRFSCPAFGLTWGATCGFLAALMNLAAIEWVPRSIILGRLLSHLVRNPVTPLTIGMRSSWALRPGPRVHVRLAPSHPGRFRPPHRRYFAPRVEILPC